MNSIKHCFAYLVCLSTVFVSAFSTLYATNNFTVNLVDEGSGHIGYTFVCPDPTPGEPNPIPNHCLDIDRGTITTNFDISAELAGHLHPNASLKHYTVKVYIRGYDLYGNSILINPTNGTFLFSNHVEQTVVQSPSTTANFPAFDVIFNSMPANQYCVYEFEFKVYSTPPGLPAMYARSWTIPIAICDCQGRIDPETLPQYPCDNTQNPHRTATKLSLGSSVADDISISPNPASSKALLQYELITPATVQIEMFDMQGRLIRTVYNKGLQEVGIKQHVIRLENLTPGIYHIRLIANDEQKGIKIVKF